MFAKTRRQPSLDGTNMILIGNTTPFVTVAIAMQLYGSPLSTSRGRRRRADKIAPYNPLRRCRLARRRRALIERDDLDYLDDLVGPKSDDRAGAAGAAALADLRWRWGLATRRQPALRARAAETTRSLGRALYDADLRRARRAGKGADVKTP
jgi:hypothetical protein